MSDPDSDTPSPADRLYSEGIARNWRNDPADAMLSRVNFASAAEAGHTRAMGTHRRVLMQAPTGADKTAMATFMTAGSLRTGFVSFFIVHRRELVL